MRNLWIPTTSASIFRDAVTRGIAHAGPYGTTSADGIYRAAISSRGGDVVVQPILVTSLLFALPLAARLSHRRLPAVVWVWGVVLSTSRSHFASASASSSVMSSCRSR